MVSLDQSYEGESGRLSHEGASGVFEHEKLERLSGLINRAELADELHVVAYRALGHYRDDLPYHNTEHMFHVAERVLELCDERGVRGEKREAVFLAALWHDADYHQPLSNHDEFTSKEHRSAHLAFDAILDAYENDGSSSSQEAWEQRMFAGRVAGLIISTEADHDVGDDALKQILNEADLDNVVRGSTTQILQNTGRLFIESLLLSTLESADEENPEELHHWCANTRRVLFHIAKTKHLMDIKRASSLITSQNVSRTLTIARRTKN
jgi:hypothetical protein